MIRTLRSSPFAALALVACLALSAGAAQAVAPVAPVVGPDGGAAAAVAVATPSSPAGIVTLMASATVQVPRDWISITFSTTRDGTDAQAVQQQLKQAVDAALAQVPRFAASENGRATTGAFSLQPRYGTKGQITGWSGNAQMTVQGRDVPQIAQLVGRIGTLTVAHVDYGLAPETRDRAEADATAQAVARYRAKADNAARLFGYARYEIREVAVQAEAQQPPRPFLMKSAAMAPADGGALPVEAGDESVVVSVSGTVQLGR
jgi:predicted secreted protein